MLNKTTYLFIIYLEVINIFKYIECIQRECNINEEFSNFNFPKDFLFGTGSSAYQIEGAWNRDGKSPHIWDTFTHEYPEKITDRSNADSACKFYDKYKEDIQLVHDLSIDIFRISISWTRILPDGTCNNIEYRGVEFYHKLIDEILSKGIQPMVTINHFDLPQALQNNGGWLNSTIIQTFTDYADLLFRFYGNKVKMWITINEPVVVQSGYSSSDFAPGIPSGHGANSYIVGHNMLLAHASVYRLYQRKYKATQKGIISISSKGLYCFPESNNDEDIKAAERFLQFYTGWFAHPIYSKEGDYPAVMKENINYNSAIEGRNKSRLPRFSMDEIEFVKGTSDFFAINYYTSSTCKAGHNGEDPSWERDIDAISDCDIVCPEDDKHIKPEGLTAILNWVKEEYNNPLVYITENGYASDHDLDDESRIKYIKEHLAAVLKSLQEGVNVGAYVVWSFLDSFELISGYSVGFGLVQVNMSDPERTRTMKKSAYYYKSLIENHKCT